MRRPPTVLVVDPDPESRGAARATLEAGGLDPLPVGEPHDALLVARHLLCPLDLILVEGRVGADLARRLIDERPEARALLVGGPEPARGWAWVEKPYTPAELLSAVEAVLAQPRAP
jgi:DNA-binding response OmpR family regulator